MVKTSKTTKVLNLEVDRKSYWLFTNSPRDNARRRDVLETMNLNKHWKFCNYHTELMNETHSPDSNDSSAFRRSCPGATVQRSTNACKSRRDAGWIC